MIKLKNLGSEGALLRSATRSLCGPRITSSSCIRSGALEQCTTSYYRCYATGSAHCPSALTVSHDMFIPCSSARTGTLRERFIQRLMLSGKKSVATKVFDESLELLMNYIKEHNSSGASDAASRLRRQDNLHSLANLTKDEIFVISLRKAQP